MNLTHSTVSTLAGAILLYMMSAPATAHPNEHEECLSFPTHAEKLAEYGYSADDQGLLAAARSGNPIASYLAYRAAYDLDSDVLISEALNELNTAEDWTIELNFQAARYLEKQGRAEGTDYLQQIASIPEAQWSPRLPTYVIFQSIEILAEAGDESYAHQLTAYFRHVPRMDAFHAVHALGAFTNSANPEIEEAWLAAAEHMSALLRSDDPRDQSGATLYVEWLGDSARKQSIVTQRIKDAFDAIDLPPDRDDEQGRIARLLDSARVHWATCELVPSVEPSPAEQPADPPPSDPPPPPPSEPE